MNVIASALLGQLGTTDGLAVAPGVILEIVQDSLLYASDAEEGDIGALRWTPDEYRLLGRNFVQVGVDEFNKTLEAATSTDSPVALFDDIALGDNWITLPGDTSDQPGISLFEVSALEGELVLDVLHLADHRLASADFAVNTLRSALRDPRRLMRRLRRAACPGQPDPHNACRRGPRCRYECKQVSISDDNRRLRACVCVEES